MIRYEGREYGTAAEIAARLGPDVTDRMIVNWRRRDGLECLRAGRAVYSPLDQAATIERDKRRSPRGRLRPGTARHDTVCAGRA